MDAIPILLILGILFFIACLFVTASIVMIVLYHIRRQRGETQKKRWLVIPIVLLVFNLLVALLPAWYLGYHRHASTAISEYATPASSHVQHLTAAGDTPLQP